MWLISVQHIQDVGEVHCGGVLGCSIGGCSDIRIDVLEARRRGRSIGLDTGGEDSGEKDDRFTSLVVSLSDTREKMAGDPANGGYQVVWGR